ncbi:MAG: SDR family NAD(P)-dependent oxidoreductase [Vicinamibacterales bacterium]
MPTSTRRVALITGGRRIGLALSEALAVRGFDVALSFARSEAAAPAAADAASRHGARGQTFRADLSNPADCDALINSTVDAFGRLDAFIHLASAYVQRPFADLTVDDWNAALNVDLRAAFLCAQSAAPHMRQRGGGHMVLISDWVSASGRPRYPGYVPYYVAKAGVIALTEALALELASDNILVNCVAPGPVLPLPGASTESQAAVERAVPLGRWGGAEAVAKAVVGLIDSDFITGETIRVDGGRHLR